MVPTGIKGQMGDVVSYFHIFSVSADFMDDTQVEHPERFVMGDVHAFMLCIEHSLLYFSLLI